MGQSAVAVKAPLARVSLASASLEAVRSFHSVAGLDEVRPSSWFGQSQQFMRTLAKRSFASGTRCSGEQPCKQMVGS